MIRNPRLEKIKIKIQDNEEIKKIPEHVVKSAIDYLGITWMHGTKASVISSACESSNKEILPAGELKKRKLQVFTGEMEIGASAIGINKDSVSGVNLPHAEESIEYAHNFKFNINEELEGYKNILKKEFVKLDDFLDYQGSFSRDIEALRRVQHMNPELFEKDKELFEKQWQKIHDGMKTHIFDKKPKEIFAWPDNYYTSQFYSFLKALEDFEDILHSPIEKANHNIALNQEQRLANIPAVFASMTKYGIPTAFSTWEEPSEEAHPGKLAFGKDLQVVFTDDAHIQEVQEIINKYGLEATTQVKSIEVLETASKIDRTLGAYFYDFYSIKKWQAI